jgi:hypothetical protein
VSVVVPGLHVVTSNEVAFVGPNNDFYHYVKSMLPKIPTKSGDGAEEVEFKNIHE